MTSNTAYEPIRNSNMTVEREKLNAAGLPRIPVDLSAHKTPIAIHWTLIILTSGILPIAGYFALHYGTDLSLNIVLSPFLALMGVMSLYSLVTRTWRLLKKDSTCRPLGQTNKWALDFFGLNFLFGFVVLTALITAGISDSNLEIVSLPHSVLLVYVCLEILLVPLAMAMGIRAPFRFSSVAAGEPLRPATYVIVEDIVAVDGQQGQAFRQAWSDRYEASAIFREHLRRMDILWGTTGWVVVAAIWGVVFGVRDHKIGYAIGWGLPWIWAGIMTVFTISMSKKMLRREEAVHRPSAMA